jgi:glyoxylase-like metal-dependent hydrolase (beta-lactamase superfamily II)
VQLDVLAEADPEVRVDPWLLRHLLLSIDDRPRSRRDQRELEVAVRRTLGVLRSRRAPNLGPPPGTIKPPALCVGVPLWAFETNSWAYAPLGPGSDCIVFDVAPDVGPLVAELRRHRLRLSAIFLTHAHLDHAGGVVALLEATGAVAPVFVHRDDLAQVTEPRGVDALLARAIGASHGSPPDLHPLDDGDRVVVAGLEVIARHAPGHTPGTSCYIAGRGAPPLLFSGDQLFADGMGRSDLAGASEPRMMASMAAVLRTLPDDVVVLPGHGEAVTLGEARDRNPFLLALGVPHERVEEA